MKRQFLVVGATVAALTLPLSGMPLFSDWATPVNIGAPVNSPAPEFVGSVSKNGLSLYLQRGVLLDEELWVVHRQTTDAAWEAPEHLPDTVNSAFNDRAARLSADGHWLVFSSNRPGGLGGFDIWSCWREDVHDDFAWQPATNVGPPVNSAADEIGPTVVQDDEADTRHLYFSSPRSGGLGGTDIYVSDWNDSGFGVPALVSELSSPLRDEGAYVRHDGRELFFNSNRDGTGFHIWASTRETTADSWSAPVKLTTANSSGQELTPVISWDGETLYFASNRPGSAASDIYVAGRAKLRSKP